MSDRRLHGAVSLCRAAVLVACVVMLPGLPAVAQTGQTQELINRIERLQQELTTLQSFVYRGQRPPAGALPPAAAAGGADAGHPATMARLSVRLSQLESEISRLTGQNEEVGHRISQIQTRLDKLVSDVDSRLAALERRSGVAPTLGGDPDAGAEPGRPSAPAAAPPTVVDPGLGPQVLGQLRLDPATGQPLPGAPAPPAARPAPPPQQQQQAARPAETPEQLYERGQTLLLRQQHDEAEAVFRSFLDAHPNHTLASNAQYWLGRTYFVRKDFQQAATTFADGLQKYPKSDKAPDSWLSLGMSFAGLGKTKEACTAYQAVLQLFPKAEDRVKRQVAAERQRAKCS